MLCLALILHVDKHRCEPQNQRLGREGMINGSLSNGSLGRKPYGRERKKNRKLMDASHGCLIIVHMVPLRSGLSKKKILRDKKYLIQNLVENGELVGGMVVRNAPSFRLGYLVMIGFRKGLR